MTTEPSDLTTEDRDIISRLGELTSAETQMPPEVAVAATALHDWAAIDALLADLVAEPVATRGDGTALRYAVGAAEVNAEIEPLGYRRRRLVVTGHDDGQPPRTVHAQRSDGTMTEVASDRFGERAIDLSAGPVRVIAAFPQSRVATPWFTI